MMSGKLMKSPYGEGLSISQVWCDVLNFLVGILCIVNGFRVEKISSWTLISSNGGGQQFTYRDVPHPHMEMAVFTGKQKRINYPKSQSL